MTTKSSAVLTEILDQASLSKPGAIKKFYQELLDAEVFIPIDPQKKATPLLPVELGSGDKPNPYIEIEVEGHTVIPIFSEKNFVEQWAGKPFEFKSTRFSQLIWAINDGTWLHLNPAQEVGKELSPWELKRLQEGKDAAADLAAELGEEVQEHSEIEVRSGNNLYPEVRKTILGIVEAYESVEAAFLVEVRERGVGTRPLVGLSVIGLSDEKKQQLRQELIDTIQPMLPTGVLLGVVDDLAEQGSPNAKIFGEATPFYFAQKRPMSSPSFLTRLLGKK